MDLVRKREAILLKAKQQVGEQSLKILSNPEKHLSELKTLILMLNAGDDDPEIKFAFFSVQKLVAYAIAELFKNILPDYAIEQSDLEIEKNHKLKKADYLLVKYEQRLLNYYKLYIDQLERMAQLSSRKRKQIESDLLANVELRKNLSLVAMQCICQLISNKPNFNYSARLIKVAVEAMIGSKLPELQREACSTFEEVFRQDHEGDTSWLVVRELTKLIKTIGITVEPKILESFLCLNIKQLEAEQEEKKSMKEIRANLNKMSKKERKQNKLMQKLKKDMLKNDLEQNKQKIANIHTQILSQIFSIYFRVLKMAVLELDNLDRFQSYASVLSPVLEGLAQFAHLINIDFFEDVFNILHRLLVSNALNERQNFHCLITIFIILTGHGEVLNTDPQRFYAHFYRILLSIDLNAGEKDILMTLRCINIMIIRCKKNTTTNRVLAFLKRFATVSLSASPELCLALLSIVRFMLSSFPKTDILLDHESSGAGLFSADIEDPEFCNAHSTQLYELCLLRNHFLNLVQNFATYNLTGGKTNRLSADVLRKTPTELLEMYLSNEDANFGLPEQEVVAVAKKNRFHGYIFNEDSLTQHCLSRLNDDEFRSLDHLGD